MPSALRSAPLLALLLCVGCESLMFYPPEASYELGEDTVRVTAEDGTPIALDWGLQRPDAVYTVLYSHGNAEDIGRARAYGELLHSLGFNVILYDYPGYGRSGGQASAAGCIAAIDAAYAAAREGRGIPADRIILYGKSLGSGPTLDLATRVPCAGVILESPFLSPFQVLVQGASLPWDVFPNDEQIQRCLAPTLILHGTADEVIPASHSQRLAELGAAGQPSRPLALEFIEGGGHNDLRGTTYGPQLITAVIGFTQAIAERQGVRLAGPRREAEEPLEKGVEEPAVSPAPEGAEAAPAGGEDGLPGDEARPEEESAPVNSGAPVEGAPASRPAPAPQEEASDGGE